MKVSNYLAKIEIDEKKSMLYSTLSRRYYVYRKDEEQKVLSFLEDVNKGTYTNEELELFKQLLCCDIIVPDDMDEKAKLEVLEHTARYQENVYKLMILATNACNFRCTYCEQAHTIKRMEEEIQERIYRLIERKARTYKKIEIDWFGGEPLLEYNSVCNVLKKTAKICEENNCELVATFTTNGYTLDEEKIANLKRLHTKCMQITLDGNKKSHDTRRVLANGEGTFSEVLRNIIAVARAGILVTLRINIDEENAEDISEITDAIPEELRSRVAISICNVFQNKERISTYALYREAIEKGYLYLNRKNTYVSCHACMVNAAIIDTDGSILLCSNTDSNEKRMGLLGKNGNLCIERTGDLYKLQTVTARNNPECRECIELPFCIGSCKYVRLRDNSKCLGKSGEGLSLKERALLDYYSDLQNEIRRKQK